MSAAKEEDKISRSESNLHQFAFALGIYSENNDPDGPMRGFPPSMGALATAHLVTWDMFNTGGSPLGLMPPIYCYRISNKPAAQNPSDDWWAEYRTYGDEAVFAVDGTFRNSRIALQEPFTRHFAIGGCLDGHATRRWGTGDFTQSAFWHQ